MKRHPIVLLILLALCLCTPSARAAGSTGPADEMMALWQEKYADMLAKAMEKSSGLVIPEPLRFPGTKAEEWCAPEKEIPKLTEIAKYSLSDKVFTVSMKSEVNNIILYEYNRDGLCVQTYDSAADINNKKRGISASFTMQNSRSGKVEIKIFETIPGGKGEEKVYERVYSFDARWKKAELDYYELTDMFPATDYPPYEEKTKSRVQVSRRLRPDLSLMQVTYSMTITLSNYLFLTAEFDESGTFSGCHARRCTPAKKKKELESALFLDRDGKPTNIQLLFEGGFNLYAQREEKPYNRPDAVKIYSAEALRNPSVSLWQVSLMIGSGDWQEVLFASEEDLFTVEADGSFRFHADAADLNGEPFLWSALSPMLPDGMLTMPVMPGNREP